MVEIAGLIKHPELMDRDTLYELRSLLALHPYYQTARLLMLQNLYLLHDPAFDEELRRAAIYITDRRVIFQMIEAAHYQIVQAATNQESTKHKAQSSESRTVTLIDSFLDAYDFSGKRVVPFFTSGGSGLGEGQDRIAKLAKGAKVLPGKRFSARASESELKSWIAGLNLD